ncbi:tetratricopeptide repeat protein [candidate division KSB1 bacterium]
MAGIAAYGLPLIVIGARSGKTVPASSPPTARAAADLMAGVILVGIALGLAGGVGQWGWISGALFALIGLASIVIGLWGMSRVLLRMTLLVAVLVIFVSSWSGLFPVYPGETDSSLAVPGLGKVVRVRDKSGTRQLIQDGFQLAGASTAQRKKDKLSVHLPLLLAERQTRSALVVGMASPWILETLNLYEIERISVSEPPPTVLDSADSLRTFLYGRRPTDPVDYQPVQFPASRHLLFSDAVYDVIIGAAVWPLSWLGDDGLSRQFLTLLRNHLTPGGGVSLAVPINALDLTSFQSVCRTFHAVFPTVSLWWSISEPNPLVIFIGWNSTSSLTIDYSALGNRLKLDEKLGPELDSLHLSEVDDLLDYYIGDESTLEGLAAEASLVDRYRSSLLFPARPATTPSPDEKTALSARGMHRWRRNVIRVLRNLGPDRETQAAVRKNLERRVEASGQMIKSHIHYFDKSPALSRDDLDHALNIFPTHAAAVAVMAARRAADLSARELLDRAPRNPDYRFDYGNLLFEQGKFAEAINHLQTAIELDPTRLDNHILLGQTYQSVGKYDEANRAFARALVVDPDNYMVQLYIGLSYYLFSRELDSAIAAFRKGIEINPDYAPFYNYLGLCYFSTKVFWRESIEEFKKAIELNPELSEAYFNLGNVYSERWHIPEAVEYYNQAIKLNPYNPVYHSALAWAHISRSSFNPAIRSFRETYALDPNEARLSDVESAVGMRNLYIKNINAGRIRIRQILVPSEDEVQLVLKRLKGGEDFPVVARDMSIAPDASKGGDLGFLSSGMVHQNIEDVVLKLKPGAISGIIRTPLGFHVVQRIN